jgi:tetratricopeptide (TPR) repeat protein
MSPRSTVSRPWLSVVLFAVATLVAVATGLALVSRPAGAAAPADVAAAKAQLQSGANQGKVDELLAARARFVALSAAEPESPALHYWVAFASWRIVPRLMNDEATRDKAKKICKSAIEHCDQALAKAPKMADAMALKAGLQGLWLSFDPGSMMTLGMQMGQTLERARELEPANPRIAFFEAMNTLHKPAFVGGGAGKARKVFDESIALFAKAGPNAGTGASGDPATFDWGRDDAFTWAGRAAVKEKDWAAAESYFEKALAANPNNGWVKHTLLPDVARQKAGKGAS